MATAELVIKLTITIRKILNFLESIPSESLCWSPSEITFIFQLTKIRIKDPINVNGATCQTPSQFAFEKLPKIQKIIACNLSVSEKYCNNETIDEKNEDTITPDNIKITVFVFPNIFEIPITRKTANKLNENAESCYK